MKYRDIQDFKWYYKFNHQGNDDDLITHWTGSLNISQRVNRDIIKRFICKQHNLARIPNRTVIMSNKEYLEIKRRVANENQVISA